MPAEKTAENKRVAIAFGVSIGVHLLIFLIVSLTSLIPQQTVAPAGIVYINLTTVRKTPEKVQGLPQKEPGAIEVEKEDAKTAMPVPSSRASSTGRSSAASGKRKSSAASTTKPSPVQADENSSEFDDLFSVGSSGKKKGKDQGFSYTEKSSRKPSTGEAAPVSESRESAFDTEQLSGLEKNISGKKGKEGAVQGSANQAGEGSGDVSGDNPYVFELNELTVQRKLMNSEEPDLSGADLEGRRFVDIIVDFEISPSGEVLNLRMFRSSGNSTADRAILTAMRNWRFASISGAKTVPVRLKFSARTKTEGN